MPPTDSVVAAHYRHAEERLALSHLTIANLTGAARKHALSERRAAMKFRQASELSLRAPVFFTDQALHASQASWCRTSGKCRVSDSVHMQVGTPVRTTL
eukprot:366501-Chlamydomonas_euryale.AAC.11